MQYTNVQDYINLHLKKYAAFSDSKSYQAFITLLSEYWYRHGYETIPEKLKLFIEDQKITTDLYEVILLGLGYTRETLYSLSSSQRSTLFNFFTDYYQYVSTPDYVKKLNSHFNESYNIYELYADYRILNSAEDDDYIYDWTMVPSPLSLINNDKTKATTELLNYDEIYNETPTYYVSKKYLEYLRKQKSILYPFKTNLLYLEMLTDLKISSIDQLVGLTTLYYFKDYNVDVEFEGITYNLSLYKIYQLWYYIIQSYNLKVYSPNLGTVSLIYYDISSLTFPYTLDVSLSNNIQAIVEEYNNLPNEKVKIEKFYNTYIGNDSFLKTIPTVEVTFSDLTKKISVDNDNILIKVINNLIDNSETRIVGVISLLTVLEDSIKSLIYGISGTEGELIVKYSTELLNLFPKFLLDPKDTGTYKLLDDFKPYHTRLITRSKYKISTGHDKFNNALLEENPRFVIHDYPGTAVIVQDDYKYSRSVETGYFLFSNTNLVETDLAGYGTFNIGDHIYSRDISTNIFSTTESKKILRKYEINSIYYLELEDIYQGPIGTFPRAYKTIERESLEMIKSVYAFFSFSTNFNANEVHTNSEGIDLLNIGDYIYAPVDDYTFAVRIVNKDFDTNTYILHHNYEGTSGSWNECYQWIKE
jgi:hypothetical protein